MKAFAAMLQNQHVGPIIDRRNGSAETRLFWAKAKVTTAVGDHELILVHSVGDETTRLPDLTIT
jgi:hypothetical protein